MSDPTGKTCRVCKKKYKKKGSKRTRLFCCEACQPIKSIWYCGKQCQIGDWKEHKKHCWSQFLHYFYFRNAKLPTEFRLERQINRPFDLLDVKKWLHHRSDSDTYKLLIDTLRLKLSGGATTAVGIDSNGEPRYLPAFRNFLTRLETRKNELLPLRWTIEMRRACKQVGMNNSIHNWSDLDFTVSDYDVT